VEKTKHTHTHTLSLSLSLCLSKRNCNYQKAQKIQIHTTHSFSLFASEFNSMLVESRFCFYYRCQQPKKVQQKKRDLEQCSRARHDASRRDRQTDRKKKRLDDSQEMPSSVMSAILQVHDITFTVTSSMIRTFHSGEPFPVLAACSISCRRRSRDVWRKVRNPPAPCEEESDRLMFAAAAASS
jgi:hypothetical protein